MWPEDRAPGLPRCVLGSSGYPGRARGDRQDLAAGGITGGSLGPPGRTAQVLLRTLVLHSWCRVLHWVDNRSVAVDQRSQGSVSLDSHYLCCFTSSV